METVSSKEPATSHSHTFAILERAGGRLGGKLLPPPLTAIITLCLLCFFLSRPVHAFDALMTGKDGGLMALVPQGEFLMGLAPDEPLGEKNPIRKIALKAFYIDVMEVTNAQYRRCVAAGACTPPSLIADYAKTFHEDGKKWYFDDRMKGYPVVGITWRQAGIYCEWAGERLPLPAEWEKAARGTDGRRFPWGNEWSPDKANWDDGGKVDGYERLAPAGSFPGGASPYGVMDMAGNVREWVDSAVVKGGSWYSRPLTLRSGDPGHDYIVERDDDMGFRCALDTGK